MDLYMWDFNLKDLDVIMSGPIFELQIIIVLSYMGPNQADPDILRAVQNLNLGRHII